MHDFACVFLVGAAPSCGKEPAGGGLTGKYPDPLIAPTAVN